MGERPRRGDTARVRPAPLAWTLLFAARGVRRRWQWTGRNAVWVGAVLALAFLVARPWFVFIVS